MFRVSITQLIQQLTHDRGCHALLASWNFLPPEINVLQLRKINHNQYGCTFVYGLTSIWINAARFRAQVSRLSICPPSGSSLGPPPVPKGSAELFIFLKVSWLVQKIWFITYLQATMSRVKCIWPTFKIYRFQFSCVDFSPRKVHFWRRYIPNWAKRNVAEYWTDDYYTECNHWSFSWLSLKDPLSSPLAKPTNLGKVCQWQASWSLPPLSSCLLFDPDQLLGNPDLDQGSSMCRGQTPALSNPR